MSKPSIREVAARAGVSLGVASHALNNRGRMSAETRLRVVNAAKELGYVPSYAAKRLRSDHIGAIGIVMNAATENDIAERYYSEATFGFSHGASASDFKLHYYHLADADYVGDKIYDLLCDGAVDGVIYVHPLLTQTGEIMEAMSRLAHMPYLLFSNSPQGADVAFIDSDGRAGARMAVDRFVDLGHKRIACLVPPSRNSNFHDRLAGAEEAAAKADLALLYYDHSSWDAPLPVDAMLRDGVTAIVAIDDIMALGLIGEIQRRGLVVPDDVAVIGFDDEPFCRLTFPTITTVSQPVADMSRTAINYVIERVRQQRADILQMVFPVELIIRESCGHGFPAPST